VKNKQNEELAVCGLAAVRALLERHPESIHRFFFREALMSEFRPYLRDFAERHILYRAVSDEELERLAKTVHHQGVTAMIDEPGIPDLDAETAGRWAQGGERVLVLDHLGNDHNLGAIVRSAAFFGIKSIVLAGPVTANLVTTSAYRVAEGGMEWVSLYRVPDAQVLTRLAGPGFLLLGADHRGTDAVRAALAKALGPAKGKMPAPRALAIAMGNEETGLSASTRTACSGLVRIPGTGDIESLNVAQSAAILLYELASGA
jgi:RNA methyltransferase, TrmH family